MAFKTLNLSLSELKDLAQKMSLDIEPRTLLLLEGPVGAGKTQFCKYLVEKLTGNSEAHSPTYSVINEYKGGPFPIYHIDLYRIQDLNDLDSTGFWDLFNIDGLVLVEWSDLIDESAFPKHWNKIKLSFGIPTSDTNSRSVQVIKNPTPKHT